MYNCERGELHQGEWTNAVALSEFSTRLNGSEIIPIEGSAIRNYQHRQNNFPSP